jgi:hypothetical protein
VATDHKAKFGAGENPGETFFTMRLFKPLTPFALRLLPLALRLLTTLAMVAILFECGLALAQAAPAVAPAAAAPTDGDVLAQSAQTIIHAAQDPTSPKYLVVIAVVFVLCQLFKRFGHRVPVVGTWLTTHPWGDWVVGVVLSLCGALMTSVGAGKGLDVGLVISALATGMAASGTPLAIFGSGPGSSPPGVGPAQAAGAAANVNKTLNS